VQTPASTVLDLPGNFGEYVSRLRARSRSAANQVKRELRHLAASGAEIREIRELTPWADRLHDIADLHYRQLNGKPFPYARTLFETLPRELGPAVRIFGAFHGDSLVGFSALLEGGTTMHSFFVGVDRRLTGSDGVYFPVNYYEPIRAGIAAGLAAIDFGRMSLRAKLRRGCRLEPTYLAALSPNRLKHAFSAVWFRAFARSIAGDVRPELRS
jgi:predicted N-acyltransferase